MSVYMLLCACGDLRSTSDIVHCYPLWFVRVYVCVRGCVPMYICMWSPEVILGCCLIHGFICLVVCMCVFTSMCLHVCMSQRTTLGADPCVLRQGFSLKNTLPSYLLSPTHSFSFSVTMKTFSVRCIWA